MVGTTRGVVTMHGQSTARKVRPVMHDRHGGERQWSREANLASSVVANVMSKLDLLLF